MSRGLLLAFLSGVAVATSSLVVKLASDQQCTVLQSGFYRNVIMITVLGILLVVSGDTGSLFRIPRQTMTWMLVRSVVSFIALMTVYALYRLMPLGDAAAIAGSAPILTGLFGFLLLGETWTLINIMLAVICWIGVALVVLTSDTSASMTSDTTTNPYLILGLTIIVPVSLATSVVISRKVAQKQSVFHVMIVTCFGIICCSLVSMAFTEGIHLPNAASWKYIMYDGIGGLASQYFLTKALSMESAASCALMRNSRVVVGFIYQIFVFNQKPTLQSMIGAVIIIGTTAVVSFMKSSPRSEDKVQTLKRKGIRRD